MNWSEKAWAALAHIYEKIVAHPFIGELKGGTLAEEKFAYYIRQDSLYLADFGKLLAVIASQLDEPEHVQTYLGFASEAISVETALHKTLFQKFNVNPAAEKSPSCLFYTSFLHAQVATRTVAVAMAAVLPCFWIYKKVGDYLLESQTPGENKYWDWMDTYGGEAFARSVDKAIKTTDEVAADCPVERRRQMTAASVTAAKMEWLFWDGAYRLERWQI